MAAYELKYTAEEIDGILESVDEKTIYGDATQSEHGLMSTTDKTKLDALPTAQQLEGSLSEKADKVSNAINGNFAGLDANGNLTDSGFTANDFATPSDIDTAFENYSPTFVCGYGVTTYSDIRDAYESGKRVVFERAGMISELSQVRNTACWFFRIQTNSKNNIIITKTTVTFNNEWSEEEIKPEDITDKVSTIVGYESDTTKYPNTKAVADYVVNKADKVSGATNGNFASLDASGNIIDSGRKHSDYMASNEAVVKYVSQNLTVSQKNQARTNIGAGTSSFSGAYNDLSGKPSLNETEIDDYEDSAKYELPITTYRSKVEFSSLTEQQGHIDDNGVWRGDGAYYLISVKEDMVGMVFNKPSDDGRHAILTRDQLQGGTVNPPVPTVSNKYPQMSVPYTNEGDCIYIQSKDDHNVDVLPYELFILNLRDKYKEDVGNKVTSFQQTPDDSHYPSEKLVKESLDSKYVKPVGGIPASDLASGVIPIVPVQDVTVGGTSVVSNGTAVIPAIPTVPTNVSSFTNDAGYLTQHQDISGKADKVLVATTEPSGGMLPNVLYEFGELSGNTTFTLATPADNTIANHYYWTFDTPSTAPTITWPTGLTWLGGSAPTISASKHYEISVLNGIAIAMEV